MTISQLDQGQSHRSVFAQLFMWGAFALLALIFCEIGSRLDDWFFDGISPLSNPSYERMFRRDEHGLRRGIPGARWKKVVLNNLGMRGENVSPSPQPGCRRWMVLGASETFGEPTMANAEYPAKLQALESASGCIDVINTAYPGIPPHELLNYYNFALTKYQPSVVLVYPSTHFYLAELPPRDRPPPPKHSEPVQKEEQRSLSSLPAESRFLERLRDSAEMPQAIQKRRLQKRIDEASAGQPPEWAFRDVPEERLQYMSDDMRALIVAIQNSGATPVMMTHAVRVANPPRSTDHDALFAMRVYVPRAKEEVIAEFEYVAADRTRALAHEMGVKVIDVAALMSGHADEFIDLVHYTPGGHEKVAQLIHSEMHKPMTVGTTRAVH
jgi:hypothetical protein